MGLPAEPRSARKNTTNAIIYQFYSVFEERNFAENQFFKSRNIPKISFSKVELSQKSVFQNPNLTKNIDSSKQSFIFIEQTYRHIISIPEANAGR